MKRCSKCRELKPFSEFHKNKRAKDGKQFYCKACISNIGKQYLPKREVFRRYGLTVEQYNAMLEKQNGVCAICGNPPNGKRLSVDHDHKTDRVRSLLCSKCNTAIGMFDENLILIAEMIKYLVSHKELINA